MKVNKHHPDYDVTMEVLCMVPTAPLHVDARHIAHDLGINVTEVRKAMRRLRSTRNVPAKCDGDGRCWIEEAGCTAARRLGQKYWRRVYGDRDASPAPRFQFAS